MLKRENLFDSDLKQSLLLAILTNYFYYFYCKNGDESLSNTSLDFTCRPTRSEIKV